MDIDSPMHAGSGQELSDFGLRYPLPLRIVALSAVTALGFASNLHLLTKLGIDTAHVLDIRLEPAQPAPAGAPPPPLPHVHPSTLYPPVYTLALSTLAWTGLGWLVHRSLTGAAHPDPALVVHYRLAPVALALAVVAALCWPANVLHRPARFRLLRALRRIVTPKLNAHVPFCDIILADILTSSAKVLGDVWLAGCLVLTGEGVSGVAGDACKRVWGVPLMTRCVPLPLPLPPSRLTQLTLDRPAPLPQPPVPVPLPTVPLRSVHALDADSATVAPQRAQVRDRVPRHCPLGHADRHWRPL